MKNNNIVKNYFRILKIIAHENKKFLFASVLLVISSSAYPFINIFLLKYLLEAIERKTSLEDFIIFAIVAVSINLAITGIKIISDRYEKLYAKVQMIPMTRRFITQSINMDYQNMENEQVIQEMNRASYVLLNKINLEQYLEAANLILISFIQLIITIVILVNTNILIFMLVLLVSILNNVINFATQKKNYIVHKGIVPIERRWRYIIDMTTDISFGKTVRLHSLKDYFLKKGEENRGEFISLHGKRLKNIFHADMIKGIISLLQELGVFIWLVYAVIYKGLLISSFTVIFNSASQMNASFVTLAENIYLLAENNNYMNDFFHFLDRKSQLRSTGSLPVNELKQTGCIEFRNVSFTYPGSSRVILKDINLKITPGESITVIGENGAGKTTLVKLLMRLYDVTSGEILYDNVNIKEYDYDEYMKVLATIFQDYRIFAFSIYENICLHEDYQNDVFHMDEILEDNNMLQKVKSLKHGGEMILSKLFDESGIELSGGQMQKIALCRAIYKDAPVIILDEPTASLSPLAEAELYKDFHRLVKNKTAIYISHRLSSSTISDKICVLHNGEIIEYGSHKQLMELNGEYKKMYELQSRYYQDQLEESE